MSLIGIYHRRKDPNRVGRAYRYASIAKIEGITFFYFTAKGVDFENKVIKGSYYENGKWLEKFYPFPDVIINHTGPITTNQKDVYYKLKKLIPFTSNPVGTKLSVYNKIKKGKDFIEYLIPYKLIKKPLDIFEFLNKYSKIIMKPISGHHGNQVVYIEKLDDSFIVKENGISNTLSRLELFNYLVEIKKSNKMLAQKYIPSRTTTGEPFDIRLHLQKDGNGNWVNTLIYPKVGFKNKVATNLGQGGKITILKNFLINVYKDDYFDIMKYLEVFSIQFANHFETLYKSGFDELGIDIGLDEDKKIWIYEVNWRPGHIFLQAKASYNAIKYANYLAIKNKEDNNATITIN